MNNNVVGENVSKGYRVLENGPVYHTLEMDNVVDWFRNVLGWIANVDARNDDGAGTFGCAMPIADPVASGWEKHSEIVEQPWGGTEFEVTTIDGSKLRIASY